MAIHFAERGCRVVTSPSRLSLDTTTRQEGARRFIAEKGDGQDRHVVAALSVRKLLDRLDEIVAGSVTASARAAVFRRRS
jgi:hypothetical protein